jgi:hypothetical protein
MAKNPFKAIGKIMKMISCPINILTNIHICGYFYFLDFFAWLGHLPFFFITFLAVFFPLQMFLWAIWMISIISGYKLKQSYLEPVLSKTLKKWFILNMDMFTVTKRGFSVFIENIYYYTIGGRFLSRSGSDIKKCYCIPPMKGFTLYNFKPFGSNVSNVNVDTPNISYIIIGLILIPYLLFSKYGNPTNLATTSHL